VYLSDGLFFMSGYKILLYLTRSGFCRTYSDHFQV
jgi:hypothetical protein